MEIVLALVGGGLAASVCLQFVLIRRLHQLKIEIRRIPEISANANRRAI